MADLYQPPSYQRPLSGRVVGVTDGEANPAHRVAIMRRGQEILISAYLDDPSYGAVPLDDYVQVARDAGGTWRILRHTEYQLADAGGAHTVKAGRLDAFDIDYTYMNATAFSDDGAERIAGVYVIASPTAASMSIRIRDGDALTALAIGGDTARLGHTDGSVDIAADSTSVSGGGATAIWAPAR